MHMIVNSTFEEKMSYGICIWAAVRPPVCLGCFTKIKALLKLFLENYH